MNKSHLHLIVSNETPIRDKPKRDPLFKTATYVVAWALLCLVIGMVALS